MVVAAQTEWDYRIPPEEIKRRKAHCLARLGIEIAPHLLGKGAVTVSVTEEETQREDWGLPRTVYTLRAKLRHTSTHE